MNFINTEKNFIISETVITSETLINAAKRTNAYLVALSNMFSELHFDIFYSLGQRNLSGFIGEVYKSILSDQVKPFEPNPHPDGRPDILSLDTQRLLTYYQKCFELKNGRPIPLKSSFSPFKFGGLEVKCCIGESSDKQKKSYSLEHDGNGFDLYCPRVGYINNINWWAHHANSTALLGLYYDYYSQNSNIPQVLAGFYSALSSDDWQKVSVGKAESKKTSNTSLNKTGKQKMKSNCVFYCSDPEYVEQFKKMKISL